MESGLEAEAKGTGFLLLIVIGASIILAFIFDTAQVSAILQQALNSFLYPGIAFMQGLWSLALAFLQGLYNTFIGNPLHSLTGGRL